MKALFSKIVLSAAAVAALGFTMHPTASQAGEEWNRVHRQQQRINKGVADGQITAHEYALREKQLRAVNAQRRADLAANGGHLTGQEQHTLNQRLNNSGRNIYFNKHNLSRQPGAPVR
jgi:hypothetical protein